jgi:hypothetical protein
VIEWTEAERGAMHAFVNAESPLRTGLQKFLTYHRDLLRESCAVQMSQVPRNHELASDYAARAQAFDEFWALLALHLEQS